MILVDRPAGLSPAFIAARLALAEPGASLAGHAPMRLKWAQALMALPLFSAAFEPEEGFAAPSYPRGGCLAFAPLANIYNPRRY